MNEPLPTHVFLIVGMIISLTGFAYSIFFGYTQLNYNLGFVVFFLGPVVMVIGIILNWRNK